MTCINLWRVSSRGRWAAGTAWHRRLIDQHPAVQTQAFALTRQTTRKEEGKDDATRSARWGKR
jgi:hypothetical protein